jgi:diaminopimelate epimerase
MHGIGNDFVLLDGRSSLPELPALSRQLCDRQNGIGADGILVLTDDPLTMRMYNPDGSESEMCGNGLRCFAIYAAQLGLALASPLPIVTGAGELSVVLQNGIVEVDMGIATEQFVHRELGEGFFGTAVSMGNPHLVIFTDDLDAVDLALLGPKFEHHELFPNRTNVHFVQVMSRSEIRVRHWERGAGMTMACGTGACASAVASFLNGHTERSVQAQLPGGVLQLEYNEAGRVLMTGPAETSFDGVWNLD